MQRAEWAEIVAKTVLRWPSAKGQIGKGTFAVWFDDLKGYEASEVAAAVDGYYREGHEWPPNGGQLIAWIERDRRRSSYFAPLDANRERHELESAPILRPPGEEEWLRERGMIR